MYVALKDQQTFASSIRLAVSYRRPAIIPAPHPTGSAQLDFARSVAAGLDRRPRILESRFLYDARGSELYEEITRQPEYYPTRTEASILALRAATIARTTGPAILVEFGSGSSAKTGFLLSAYQDLTSRVTYLPVDISRSALQSAATDIGSGYPEVQTIGIHGTYEAVLPLLEDLSPVMVVFLGSTVGNFDDAGADLFFRTLSGSLRSGDFFLLGVDLVKEPEILEAAYDDAAGITAAFTRNLFERMNRELESTIEPDAVDHVAQWNPQAERIEIYARFSRAQTIRIAPLELSFEIPAGESIRTEISRKFRVSPLLSQLRSAGFETRQIFSDPQQWFALLLLEKTTLPRLPATPSSKK